MLRPGRLCGEVEAPPSKSAAHRAILCAALAALCGPGRFPFSFQGPLPAWQ